MAGDLQSLLDKIREEGFQKAQAEKDALLTAAREEAAAIREAAEKEALRRREEGAAELKQLEARSREALNQAARDTALKLQSELENRLKTALAEAVGAALTPTEMAAMIAAIAQQAAADPDAGADVLVAPRDREKLEAALAPMLAESFRKAPRVLADGSVKGGFQISLGEGSCYCDFSSEALTELLVEAVGGKLAALLKAK